MNDPKSVLVLGVVAGLLVAALIVTLADDTARASSFGVRPNGVPADAILQDNVYGKSRWFHCAVAKGGISCKAYSRSGVEVVSANYVPRDGKAPAAPFEQIVAAEVEKVWLNKIAMVPHGTAKFAGGSSVEYDNGVRQGMPK